MSKSTVKLLLNLIELNYYFFKIVQKYSIKISENVLLLHSIGLAWEIKLEKLIVVTNVIIKNGISGTWTNNNRWLHIMLLFTDLVTHLRWLTTVFNNF